MTGAPPLISVVIPAYDAEAYMAECLRSVQGQIGEFELETIVVDDGSGDDTAAIARLHPDVKCLTQPNRGPGAARNAGIAAAQGEFIALLDADDLWPPGKLAAQLQILKQHEGAGLVFGDCRQFDTGGSRPRTEFEANGLGTAAWGTDGLVQDAYPRLLVNNFITTGSVVLRRAALDEVGVFAEDLHLVEDLDLWLRIARRHSIAWCGEVCLLRRRHDANTSRDPEAMSLAYLDVLRRQGEAAPAGTIRRLAACECRRLARTALVRGQIGLALQRAWCSLRPLTPSPATHGRR